MTDISADDLHSQVDRILASPGFIDAGRLGPLLKVLVDRALSGDAQNLKESVPGVEVLRPRLEKYYQAAGKDDPIIIKIPEGVCIPVFRRSSAPGGYQPTTGRRLLMMGLCMVALIIVWAFYFIAGKQSP